MKIKTIISMIIIIFLFTGCAKQSITKAEASEWVNSNKDKAVEIFSIFNSGADISNSDESLWIQDGIKTFAPYENDFYESIADIKTYTESVYTSDYAEKAFYQPYFESDDENEVSMPLYKEFDGILYVNVNNGGKGWPVIDWLTDTIELKESSPDSVILEMETLRNGEPDGKRTLILKKVDGLWLLDSSIFDD